MPGIGDEHRNGVIHRLEVDNFKSYKGNQVIGPFKNFTAVVGPNGAGKSNLMDAISFVLGVRSAHLRGSQLKDLVYAADDRDREQPGRRASVSLVYLMKDNQGIPEDGREINFTRAITPAGSSEYRVNGQVVTWDEYCSRLKQLGILVKARNFLVFQGDVESIAAKNPKDLTALFEQISGSDEFKKDFEAKEKAKSAAEEQLLLVSQKKKTINQEKRQKKEQKDEAEHHMKKQKELKDERAKYLLWQLLCLERDIDVAKASLEKENSAVSQVAEEQLAVEADVKDKQRLRKEYSKSVLLAEKNVAKKQGEIEKKRPDMLRLSEEIGRMEKRLQKDENRLQELQQSKDEQSRVVNLLENQISDMKAQLAEIQGTGNRPAQAKLQLGQEQMAEYNKKKEEVGEKTSKLRQEKETLARQQQADTEAKRNLEASLSQLQARADHLTTQLEQTKEHAEQMAKEVAERTEALKGLRKRERDLTDDHRRSQNKVEALQVELAKKEQALRDLKADFRENEREMRAAETVTAMQRLFSGVYGRLTDLCQLSQRKYSLAVTVAFGKLFDAIAVKSEATAKSCIEYLREQRLPPMTFIPLDTARVRPVDERLRMIGGSARLALDVIQYDPEVEVAMLYALGSTLVCDTLDEARPLAWGEFRQKVVTLDGTLLARNGCMTGGTSGGMEARSQQWDRKEIEKLKSERDEVARTLQQAESVRDAQAKERQLAASITTAEQRLQFAQAEENMARRKVARLQEELTTIAAEKSRKEPEVATLTESLTTRGAELAQREQHIARVTDAIFKDFSRRVGVKSLREYEEGQLREAQAAKERELAVQGQLTRLETQLEYEKSRDTEGPLAALQSRLQAQQDALAELRSKAEKMEAAVEKLRQAKEGLQKPLQEAKAALEAVEAELQQLSRRLTDITSRMGKAKRSATAKETTLVQLRSRRSELLEACSLEQVEVRAKDGQPLALPLLLPPGMASQPTAPEGETGSGADASSQPVGGGSGRGGGSRSGSGSGSGSGVPAFGGRPGEEDVPLDYSRLDRRLQQAMSDKRREEVGAELLAHIEALRAALEAVSAPNLKAVEQFEAVRVKEREAAEEFEEARRVEREAARAFMEVQQQRVGRFMACFSHVASAIDPIYKALTISPLQPHGGTAYLALESESEPFTAGVKYSAMPPSKRFRDMEQLSGGEKTVAALALLFAIHSFRPSPFFVLDEVDAALDNLNVAKVANFIRSRSRLLDPAAGPSDGDSADVDRAALAPLGVREHGFQSIVISLKDQFFATADALVGVVRDHDSCSSKTLTFDLNCYPA